MSDTTDNDLPTPRSADDVPGGFGSVEPPVRVELQRSGNVPTDDQPLWTAIRNRTNAINFARYAAFVEEVLCRSPEQPPRGTAARNEPEGRTAIREFGSPSVGDRRANLGNRKLLVGSDSYHLLKLATQAFLLIECGLVYEQGRLFDPEGEFASIDSGLVNEDEEARRLMSPGITEQELRDQLNAYLNTTNQAYLGRVARAILGPGEGALTERLPYCEGILRGRLSCPSMIELIWCYWNEQGMLVQTMNAVLLRFQNKRNGPGDPLINLELDPLRGLNNLLWGFLQDESNRLTVARRAYEYDHHYGLTLTGKSIPSFHPADSRVRFVEAFHTLLYRAMQFYREDDDTTVVADGFAMLNALREVHVILGEGFHNQAGEMPWYARQEMLMSQWLLSRQEIREFIRGRHMVPYQEPWMGPVDDMKRLQGWTEVSSTHFHELAVHSEQLLLSVRFGDWIDVNDQEQARNWARYWRPEIQRYIHAYNAVTGVDLSVEISDGRAAQKRFAQPSALIAARERGRRQDRRTSQGTQGPRKLGHAAPMKLPAPGRQRT